MRRTVIGAAMLAIACMAGLLSWSPTHAASVGVSVGVGDTTVHVQGSTSPLALVTIMDGSSVIGTTAADASGNFSHIFTNQTPGIHTYQVYSEDTSGRISDTSTVSVSVQEHAQTTVTVFLAPTVEVSDNDVTQGDPITIRGATVPNAKVIIYIDDTYVLVTTNAAGEWSYVLETGNLEPGEHQFYVKAIKSGGSQSDSSEIRTIIVRAKPGEGTPTPPPTKKIVTPGISSPKSGTTTSESCITLSGTGQPGTQIEVWNRGQLIGSVLTDQSGHWKIKVCLSAFENDLKVRACSGDVCSAFSRSIKIFRENPPRPEALQLTLNKYRLRTLVSDPITITAHISGGQGPYRLVVDWGDGQTTELSRSNTLQFLTHRYQEAGLFNGTITVTDSNGERVTSSFSVVVTAETSLVSSWASALIAPAVAAAATTTFVIMFPKPYLTGKRWVLRGIRRLSKR